MLTITGPSGVGKTRLAIQVAQSLEGDLPDGVLFFDLAPLHDAARVPEWIIQALALREQGDISVISQLISFFQKRKMLLFLDNFEQVVDAAPVVADLLGRCPGLRVLVTSRIPLHIRGEQVLPLAPLELPEAINLFKERALSISPAWSATEAELSMICERLDCLPLAI